MSTYTQLYHDDTRRVIDEITESNSTHFRISLSDVLYNETRPVSQIERLGTIFTKVQGKYRVILSWMSVTPKTNQHRPRSNQGYNQISRVESEDLVALRVRAIETQSHYFRRSFLFCNATETSND